MMDIRGPNIKRLLEVRSKSYKLFSLGFCPPRTQTLSGITETSFENAENLPSVFASFLFPDAEMLQFQKEAKDCLLSDAIRKLNIEYVRLFLGPRRALVSPYESTYMSRCGMVMAEPAVQVLARYKEAGLQLHPEFKNLPDHIAAELEYLHYLCNMHSRVGATLWEQTVSNLSSEREFLQKHLAVWVPSLLEGLIANTDHEFYLRLADAVEKFLRFEQEHLAASVTVLST